MTKHVIDTPSSHETARLSRYLDLEKRDRLNGLHPSVSALKRRTQPPTSETHRKAFLRTDAENG